jgi:hypothetical protein
MVVAAVAFIAFPFIAMAQESWLYTGGTFNVVTQTHSDKELVGGTTRGGSALFGVQVSPRVAVEFEPSFGGRSENNLALVGGVDAALQLVPHLYLVPTFRMLAVATGTSPDSPGDPLGAQTSTGSFLFRYGAGARVAF